MKLTEKQEKDIIKIFSNPKINESIKINFLRHLTNNKMELLLAEIKGRLED